MKILQRFIFKFKVADREYTFTIDAEDKQAAESIVKCDLLTMLGEVSPTADCWFRLPRT